jgi:integrase
MAAYYSSAMAEIDLSYLWFATGRKGRQYPFYRREPHLIPLTAPDGRRIVGDHDVPAITEAWSRIHARFEEKPEAKPRVYKKGTIGHIITEYRKDPDYTSLRESTRKTYDQALDWLLEHHADRYAIDFPRDAAYAMRNELQDTPGKSCKVVDVLSILFSFAEDRPTTFSLPPQWHHPARRIKKLKLGEGFDPWEEWEIEQFRRYWPAVTRERVSFEGVLNTGQRGCDVAPMLRAHLRDSEIKVVQSKTGKRVWVGLLDDLRDVLEPWLASHPHKAFFPTRGGTPMATGYFQDKLREAIVLAGLPDHCTVHGLRYTYATRGIEFGLDHQTMESIVGHDTMENAFKYTRQRRQSRFATATINAGLRQQRFNQIIDPATDAGNQSVLPFES